MVRFLIGSVISLITIYLALRRVSFTDIGVVLSRASIWYVIGGLLCVAATTLAKGMRWKILLDINGQEAGLGRVTTILLVGQMLNLIYPARLGDLSRAYLLGKGVEGKAFTLGTVAVEKLFDLVSYTLLFLGLLIWMPMPVWVSRSAYTLVGITVLLCIAAFFLIRSSGGSRLWVEKAATKMPWISKVQKSRLLAMAQAMLESLNVLKGERAMVWLGFWSIVVWSTAVLNNQLALLALGLHLPLSASILVLVALQIGITLPSIPGRIGIFEYICILCLSIFQLPQSEALGFGILLHMIVLLPTTLLGLLFFIWYSTTGRILPAPWQAKRNG